MLRAASVGERVLYARTKVGLSQRELAEAIGSGDYRLVLRWENGYFPPRRPYREKLSAATGYPPEFFEASPET